MSGQLLELIIFAGIAIFLVSKLISILGTTSDDDPTKQHKSRSYFGEARGSGAKEVESVVSTPSVSMPTKRPAHMDMHLNGLIVDEHKEDILKGLRGVLDKVPSFTVEKFLKGAKMAFKVIIEAGTNENDAELKELVDMRYIGHFKEMAQSYGQYQAENSEVSAKVSEIYMFGNNVFVKVLFAGKNITDKIKSMHEEWTFTKNAYSEGPTWQLSNIDRPQ